MGTSPLHLAAQNNHLEICEILLRAGISRDARTKVDRTPLHMAAYEGHLEIVETLLMHGADYDCKDLVGRHSREINILNVMQNFHFQHTAFIDNNVIIYLKLYTTQNENNCKVSNCKIRRTRCYVGTAQYP